MEDQQQPFTGFLLEVLISQSTELGQQWAASASNLIRGEESRAEPEDTDRVGYLVRVVLTAAAYGSAEHNSLQRIGTATGIEAYRKSMSLHLMLKELDLLNALLLHGAEEIAHHVQGTGQEGLLVARQITDATAELRLAAATSYIEAVTDELRERYRAIRHDLRNPLGTIKSAVALLTDETMPTEMRESKRVHAMVVRNTSSIDQLINEALGDTAARLHAFETPQGLASEVQPGDSPLSTREQRDDISSTRE